MTAHMIANPKYDSLEVPFGQIDEGDFFLYGGDVCQLLRNDPTYYVLSWTDGEVIELLHGALPENVEYLKTVELVVK